MRKYAAEKKKKKQKLFMPSNIGLYRLIFFHCGCTFRQCRGIFYYSVFSSGRVRQDAQLVQILAEMRTCAKADSRHRPGWVYIHITSGVADKSHYCSPRTDTHPRPHHINHKRALPTNCRCFSPRFWNLKKKCLMSKMDSTKII